MGRVHGSNLQVDILTEASGWKCLPNVFSTETLHRTMLKKARNSSFFLLLLLLLNVVQGTENKF